MNTQSAEAVPDYGTWLAASLVLIVIVAAGFMLRFGLAAGRHGLWRPAHVGVSLSRYALAGIHALRNYGSLQLIIRRCG